MEVDGKGFPFSMDDFNMFHVSFQGCTQHDILVEYPWIHEYPISLRKGLEYLNLNLVSIMLPKKSATFSFKVLYRKVKSRFTQTTSWIDLKQHPYSLEELHGTYKSPI